MTVQTPPLAKIEQAPQTLRDIVQDRMRTAIINGAFEPGQRLVERPLCQQLGVSRTVVRETIRYLEAEGLVEILPNRGPIVARLDWDQARQIYEIRRQLESAAAMACARVGSDVAHAKLKQSLDQLEAAFEGRDMDTVFRRSSGFYQAMFDGAGHDVAWDIVQKLNGRISRLRVLTLSTPDRAQPGLAHLQDITQAILSRKPKAAKRAVQRHITDAACIAQRKLAPETRGQSDNG